MGDVGIVLSECFVSVSKRAGDDPDTVVREEDCALLHGVSIIREILNS